MESGIPINLSYKIRSILLFFPLLILILLTISCAGPVTPEDAFLLDFFKDPESHKGVEDYTTGDIIRLHKQAAQRKSNKIDTVLKTMDEKTIIDWALITLVLGNIETVEIVLKRAVLIKKHGALFFQIGICQLILDKDNEVMESFEQALRADPPFREALPSFISACMKQERLDKAMETEDTALTLWPEDPITINNIILLYLYIEEQEKAEKLLEKKADIFTSWEYLQLKAQVRMNIIPDVHDDRFSRHADLAVIIGNTYFDRGEYEKAEIVYKRALLLDPFHLSAGADLGLALTRQGKEEEALEFYGEKIGTHPDFELLRYNRGNLYKESGNKEKAIEDYEKCLEIFDEWVEPMFQLASVYILTGKKEKAAVYLEKLKALNVDTLALDMLMTLDD